MPAVTGKHADESVETVFLTCCFCFTSHNCFSSKCGTAGSGDPGSQSSSLQAHPGIQLSNIKMDI